MSINNNGIKQVKSNKLDDRAYTLCMACYALSEERRKVILAKPKAAGSVLDKLVIRRGSYNGKTI